MPRGLSGQMFDLLLLAEKFWRSFTTGGSQNLVFLTLTHSQSRKRLCKSTIALSCVVPRTRTRLGVTSFNVAAVLRSGTIKLPPASIHLTEGELRIFQATVKSTISSARQRGGRTVTFAFTCRFTNSTTYLLTCLSPTIKKVLRVVLFVLFVCTILQNIADEFRPNFQGRLTMG